jgi:hypothetical protein
VTVIGRVYFHIRGRQPNSVLLYLRALEMNPLYYTELGRHNHTGALSGDVGSTELTPDQTKHQHNAQGGTAGTSLRTALEVPTHHHSIFGRLSETGVSIGSFRGFVSANTDDDPLHDIADKVADGGGIDYQIRGGSHRHDVLGATDSAGFRHTHTHSLNGISAAIASTGVDLPARARSSGPLLTFVNDLQISIGRTANLVNRTLDIRRQLAGVRPGVWSDNAGNPKTLGDGSGNHELVMNGTGPIRLDFLPSTSFTEDEYCIELSVDVRANNQPNGGRILYNLYIE